MICLWLAKRGTKMTRNLTHLYLEAADMETKQHGGACWEIWMPKKSRHGQSCPQNQMVLRGNEWIQRNSWGEPLSRDNPLPVLLSRLMSWQMVMIIFFFLKALLGRNWKVNFFPIFWSLRFVCLSHALKWSFIKSGYAWVFLDKTFW